MIGNKEIVNNLDKRLSEVNILLKQAVENYFNPEIFIANIKATIQAHRNVTFALQNEKSKFPIDFENWYKPWQDKMKKDKLMKWLNDTRVDIVHCKDFKAKSTAKVRVYNYSNIFAEDIDIPIELEIDRTIKYLIRKNVISPKIVLLRSMVEIERVWVANDFESFDILSIIEYGFSFLCSIMRDAYKVFGLSECEINEKVGKYLNIENQLLCLTNVKKARKTSLSTEDFTLREYRETEVLTEKLDIKSLKKHYKVKDEFFSKNRNGENKLDKLFNSIIDSGKLIISKDKFHRPLAVILRNEEPIDMMNFELRDKSSKFMMMESIANKVKNIGGDGIIIVVETWLSSDISMQIKKGTVAEAKDRREALLFNILTKENYSKSILQYFKRNLLGQIKFEEQVELKKRINSLEAFYRLWNL